MPMFAYTHILKLEHRKTEGVCIFCQISREDVTICFILLYFIYSGCGAKDSQKSELHVLALPTELSMLIITSIMDICSAPYNICQLSGRHSWSIEKELVSVLERLLPAAVVQKYNGVP